MSNPFTRKTQIVVPIEVVSDIDKLVGKRARSAFLVELVRQEMQRRKQLDALRAADGAWKDEDHPELKDGAEAWVRKMRSESESRFQEIEEHRNSS